MPIIRPFSSKDINSLVQLIEELQDHIIEVDSLHRNRRLPEYGETAIAELLKKVRENDGVIFLAESDSGEILGMIAGVIEKSTKTEELEIIPTICGNILELIVNKSARGQNIGSRLMAEIEKFFRSRDCTIYMVDVFAPNERTHEFYKKLGYENRMISMIKPIV